MIKVVLDTNVLISALLKEGNTAPAMIIALLRKKQCASNSVSVDLPKGPGADSCVSPRQRARRGDTN
jgi:hypothetical protein